MEECVGETGVYVAGSVPAHNPSHIARNVQDAVKWAMQQEGVYPEVV